MSRPDDTPGTSRPRGQGGGSLPGDDEYPETVDELGAARPFRPRSWALLGEGELVSGRYRVVRLLGSGGFAEVYEVADEELGQSLALKALHVDARREPAALPRFRREMVLAREVRHDNVCRILEFGRHDRGDQAPVFFLTMELLGGETLADRLQRDGAMSLPVVLDLAEQIAAGLAAAHDTGVVHRDLKAGNVMLVDDPSRAHGLRAVVTDFGLARHAAGSEIDGAITVTQDGIVGTPAYMAPEQIEGGDITPATDVYAFGVLLFQMVTGQLPFAGDTPLASALQRLKVAAPSPRRHLPDLPPPWEGVILRCLERDPRERFATAPAVIEALTGTRRLPWTRRRRRLLATAAAAGVLLALLAVLGWSSWSGRPGPPPSLASLVPVQLTVSAGLDLHPAISPDGARVAFASNRTGAFELYTAPLQAGAEERQLTADGAENVQPDWSPDGRFLVYHSQTQGGLWLVPAAGGRPERLTAFGSNPAWSPDGRWIAFQGDSWPDHSASALPALPPSTLWLVAAGGGEPRRLTTADRPTGGHGAPAWSPDGLRVAFSSSSRERSEIWSIAAAGGEPAPLVRSVEDSFNPTFSPDGRSLYYTAHVPGGSQGLWNLALEGGAPAGEPRQLANLGVASISELALSPDGDRLAYTAVSTSGNLWLLEVDEAGRPTARERAVTHGSTAAKRPAFSPDGRLVAYDGRRTGGGRDVWIAEVEGGAPPRQLTSQEAWDSMPRWSPDGAELSFHSQRTDRPAIYATPVEGGDERLLYELPEGVSWAMLSPDERRVAFHAPGDNGQLNLFVAELPDGEPRQITFDRELMAFPSWSPDGALLAFEVKRGQDTFVSVVESDGGAPHQLDDTPGQSWPFGWSPDGRKIGFAAFRDGLWNLWWIDLDGRTQRLTDNRDPSTYLRYPAFSPDGRLVAYERAETLADVWLIDGLP